MNKDELWQATLAQLQFKISPANFATWLKNTFILSKKEGTLFVSVPNNFSKEWLEHKYNKIIFHAIKSLDNEVKEIRYTVERSRPKPKEAPSQPVSLREEDQMEFPEFKVDRSTNLNPRYSFDNFIVGGFNEP